MRTLRQRLGGTDAALVLVVLAAFIVYLAFLLSPAQGRVHDFMRTCGDAFVYVAAAVFMARRHDGRGHWIRGWGGLAVAYSIIAVATFSYYLDVSVAHDRLSFLLGDAVWLTSYPFTLLGVAGLVGAAGVPALRAVLVDVLLVACGTLSLTALALSEAMPPAVLTPISADLVINLVSVFFDVLLIAIITAGAQRANWRVSAGVWVLLGAAFVYAVFDSQYAITAATGDYDFGGLLDLGWPISALLFVFAGVLLAPGVEAAAPARTAPRNIAPAIFSLIATLVLMADVESWITMIARVAALCTIALALLRLQFAVTRSNSLATQLRAASIDGLTGLANRRALLGANRITTGDALIVFDVDGLSDINARYGADIGDQVLLRTADRLKGCVRSDDWLLRIGEDRFAVLVRNATVENATRVAENVVNALEVPMLVLAHSVSISACAGVSTQAAEGTSADHLLTEATSALQLAQSVGSGIVRAFSGLTGERSQDRLRMRAEIKDLLRRDPSAFVPVFQPITRIEDGAVLAVETLVRWNRDGRMLPPAEFLGELERSGSMRSLTSHLLRTALRQVRSSGLTCPITLNISPTLLDEALPDMVDDAIMFAGVPRELLIVEITEDAIIAKPEVAAEVLRELRTSGVRVFIDDFGTGWSGLSMLRDFEVDGIKLDRSFTTGMWSDPTAATIVHGVVRVARELGISVIYEGVETTEVLENFRDQSDCYVQGFATAQPMPIDRLRIWLEHSTHFSAPWLLAQPDLEGAADA